MASRSRVPQEARSKPTRNGKPCDYIEGYATYADLFELPRAMHEHAAIQTIATLLNRNGVLIPDGAFKTPFDVWTLLLSASGGGRSTTVHFLKEFLKKAGVDDIVSNVEWGSVQALTQHFAENPTGLFDWGEFSERLKTLKSGPFGAALPWITNIYNSLSLPPAITHRKTGRETDTPDIVFHQAPRLNIFATSSEAWFFKELQTTDSTGGFLPRWMFVRVPDENRSLSRTLSPDSRLESPLIEALREIRELKGEADLTAIDAQYDFWYHSTRARFKAHPNRDLADAYWHRHRIHVQQLAVIFQVSMSRTLQVTPEAWTRAVAAGAELERTIFEFLNTGVSTEGHTRQKMEQAIQRAGADGLIRSEWTIAFQGLHPQKRNEALFTIIDSAKVVAFSRKGKTKPTTVYVHADFVDAYESRHPEDQRKS